MAPTLTERLLWRADIKKLQKQQTSNGVPAFVAPVQSGGVERVPGLIANGE